MFADDGSTLLTLLGDFPSLSLPDPLLPRLVLGPRRVLSGGPPVWRAKIRQLRNPSLEWQDRRRVLVLIFLFSRHFHSVCDRLCVCTFTNSNETLNGIKAGHVRYPRTKQVKGLTHRQPALWRRGFDVRPPRVKSEQGHTQTSLPYGRRGSPSFLLIEDGH